MTVAKNTQHRRAKPRNGGSRGPETRLTSEVIDRICKRIESGVWWVGEAVQAEGFNRNEHYRWLREGAHGREPYATYKTKVEQAKADLEARMLEKLGDLSRCGDPKVELAAVQWRLQNLNPARYGRKLEIKAAQTPTREAFEAMTDEELEAEVKKAMTEGGDDAG